MLDSTLLEKYRVICTTKTLYETENQFKIEGMIAPRLHNEGETPITILNTTVEAGQQFNLSANPYIPMQGSITIDIAEEEEKKGKAVIVYNKIIKKDC